MLAPPSPTLSFSADADSGVMFLNPDMREDVQIVSNGRIVATFDRSGLHVDGDVIATGKIVTHGGGSP